MRQILLKAISMNHATTDFFVETFALSWQPQEPGHMQLFLRQCHTSTRKENQCEFPNLGFYIISEHKCHYYGTKATLLCQIAKFFNVFRIFISTHLYSCTEGFTIELKEWWSQGEPKYVKIANYPSQLYLKIELTFC